MPRTRSHVHQWIDQLITTRRSQLEAYRLQRASSSVRQAEELAELTARLHAALEEQLGAAQLRQGARLAAIDAEAQLRHVTLSPAQLDVYGELGLEVGLTIEGLLVDGVSTSVSQ